MILNRIIDKKILERANVYILDNKIIKYRGGSENSDDIRYMMGRIVGGKPLNLENFTLGKYNVSDYGFSETDVKSHICDLILKGKDLVWQNNRHIDIYTTREMRGRYDDCIDLAREFNIDLNLNIIIRE